MKMLIRLKLLFMLTVLLCAAVPVAAQEIEIRVSVKFILDSNGNRPTGTYSTNAEVDDAIRQTNQALRRWGRGYQYVITEFRNVANASEYFDFAEVGRQQTEECGLNAAIRKDPDKFFWRTNATNVFIVNTYNGFNARGGAGIPSGPPLQCDAGKSPIYRVVLAPNLVLDQWAHELGHHNDLWHTFDGDDSGTGRSGDGVADTRPDPNPAPPNCPDVNGNGQICDDDDRVAILLQVAQDGGWSQQEFEDIRWNNMGYYPRTINDARMTEGQLDRWTDATRRYNRGEVSGLTYFVDHRNNSSRRDGYSASPYPTVASGVAAANPAGGDIVLIRAGTYNERITITKRVTLRTSRGSVVTIGQ